MLSRSLFVKAFFNSFFFSINGPNVSELSFHLATSPNYGSSNLNDIFESYVETKVCKRSKPFIFRVALSFF